MKHAILAVSALLLTAAAGVHGASAAEFEVKMLNKGEKGAMVFEPDLVKAAPGDTIKFVPVDAGHNAETIKGMIPDGAEAFKSKPSQEFSVTLDKEGLYGIKCTPHFGMGMVALIVIGQPTNLDAAAQVKNPPKVKARFEELFAAAK
ncbi:pseudoazurin [Mangrovicella endophytica]|uniref:pseudoazurin n=1 Tax=Mangrovicella endophytica TaxID=2066697 RepID=UPI000C9EAEC2|nr:pseudoazurin [Mangrovicella endophytica]